MEENEKQKLLENFQSSGMTQAAFAVENGINPKTLARWIYQSRLQEKLLPWNIKITPYESRVEWISI